MPSCWEEAISALYIGVTGRFRLSYEDRAIEAEDKLDRLLRQLDRREQTLSETRSRHRSEALALRHDRTRARNKLMDYKRADAELGRIAKYRETVLQHMDALKNTELNKSLIHTLQESSRTLRDLGVMDGVRQAEAVVHDVETSMMQVQELTSVLGTPMPSLMDAANFSTEDLDEELEQLLLSTTEEENDRPAMKTTMREKEARVKEEEEEEEVKEDVHGRLAATSVAAPRSRKGGARDAASSPSRYAAIDQQHPMM